MVVPLRTEEVPQDLICAICLSVSSNPRIVAECSHVFCKTCIEQSNSRSYNALCPVCRCDSSVVRPLKEFSPIAYRIWSGIAVKCDNHGEGCVWTGSVSEYASHVCPKAAAQRSLKRRFSEIDDLQSKNQRLNDENNRMSIQLFRLRSSRDSLVEEHHRVLASSSILRETVSSMGAQLNRLKEKVEEPLSNGNGGYEYDRTTVARLTKLICQDLEDKPWDIDSNKIFECVKNIFRDLQKNYHVNPHFYIDVRMLANVCLASAWFTNNQLARIREMVSQQGM